MDKLAADGESFPTLRESYDAFLGPATEYANLMQGAMYRQRSG